MAHISSIGAGLFTDLAVAMPGTPINFSAFTYTKSNFDTAFSGNEIESNGGTKDVNTFVRVKNIRSFPSIGTPANIVNVPVYGQRTSQTIGGQSDAPTFEFELNIVMSDWASGSLLGDAVGSGNQFLMRFTLLNAEPTTYKSLTGSNIGTVQNSMYYWVGKVESLLITPQLTDANTATLTISIQSKFYGAYTI